MTSDEKSRSYFLHASIGCYRRAAELGSPSAMDALATALSDGAHRRTRDVAEAIRWYRRAIALGGDSFNLAVAYQNLGQHEVAVRWFRKSPDVIAVLELAKAELHGIGMRRNVPSAMTKLRRVATARSPDVVAPFHREEAMRIIADVLYHGWLVPRDYRGAVRWLRRAAKSGSDAARGLLRDLCERAA